MNKYTFVDSETQDVSKTLLIGLAGPSGGGKTESMLRIARGIVGPDGKFAVIDTENRRALNKKARYRFSHLDMKPPYSPEAFKGAIEAAIDAGHGCICVDSFSAEWDGEGGLSEQSEDILERMSKGDPAKAERLTALAWKDPKRSHKRLMSWLRNLEVPIIFGLRAEPKIKFTKDQQGKTQVVDAGWLPIAEKLFAYDMLIYALMMPDNPGVPVHLKKLEPEFEPMFPVGKQITEDCGGMLAQWSGPRAELITADEALALEARCTENQINVESLRRAAKVERLSQITKAALPRANTWIDAAIEKRKATVTQS